jgi:hypothetical protein
MERVGFDMVEVNDYLKRLNEHISPTTTEIVKTYKKLMWVSCLVIFLIIFSAGALIFLILFQFCVHDKIRKLFAQLRIEMDDFVAKNKRRDYTVDMSVYYIALNYRSQDPLGNHLADPVNKPTGMYSAGVVPEGNVSSTEPTARNTQGVEMAKSNERDPLK